MKINETFLILKIVFRIHLIDFDADLDLDPVSKLEKMDPDPGNFFNIYWIFFKKQNFQIFLSYLVSLIFMLKLDEPFRNKDIF